MTSGGQDTLEGAVEVSDVATAGVDVSDLGVRVGSAGGCTVSAEGSSVDGVVVDALARLFVVLHRSRGPSSKLDDEVSRACSSQRVADNRKPKAIAKADLGQHITHTALAQLHCKRI